MSSVAQIDLFYYHDISISDINYFTSEMVKRITCWSVWNCVMMTRSKLLWHTKTQILATDISKQNEILY